MNTPVSFELAKLLKEKEYKDKNILGSVRLSESKYYDPNGLLHDIKNAFEENDYKIADCFNAPTIVTVVMWLYEKHGIWITVTSISQESWQCHICKKGDSLGKCYFEDFYSPTEAYEAAIEYILNKLI